MIILKSYFYVINEFIYSLFHLYCKLCGNSKLSSEKGLFFFDIHSKPQRKLNNSMNIYSNNQNEIKA